MHSKLFNIWKCALAKSNEIQGFIKALLIMSVLWKKIEFYKEESNREAIELLLGALGGKGDGLRTFLSKQVFPLWEHFPPMKFFPLPIKVLVSPIVT